MFKKWIIGGMFVALAAILLIAAMPSGMTHYNSLWIGSHSGTATTTPGDNDLYVYGTFEVDGAARFDGGVTAATANLIATKRIPIQLSSVFVDGSGPIGGTGGLNVPYLTTADNVGAIVWDDSLESVEIQFNWSPSVNYVDGLQIEAVVSSSTADGTDVGLDWAIFVHDTSTSFGTSIAQDSVRATGATLDASGEVITLTLNATGEAAITSGSSVVTIALFNSAVAGSLGTTEIKAITILEPQT